MKELMRMSEEADGKAEKPVINIPEEIKLRKEQKKALEEARAEMEKMYEAAQAEGAKTRKKLDEYQHNFTDTDSRIMKAGKAEHYEQSYNAQAAVDTEGSMLILGICNTKRE